MHIHSTGLTKESLWSQSKQFPIAVQSVVSFAGALCISLWQAPVPPPHQDTQALQHVENRTAEGLGKFARPHTTHGTVLQPVEIPCILYHRKSSSSMCHTVVTHWTVKCWACTCPHRTLNPNPPTTNPSRITSLDAFLYQEAWAADTKRLKVAQLDTGTCPSTDSVVHRLAPAFLPS